MNINELIAIIKNKLEKNILIDKLVIEDKSFLHKNHPGNQMGKYHLKISIKSKELVLLSKIDSNKKIYKILEKEMKDHIHSIQILIR